MGIKSTLLGKLLHHKNQRPVLNWTDSDTGALFKAGWKNIKGDSICYSMNI